MAVQLGTEFPNLSCNWMGPCDEALADEVCGEMMLETSSSLTLEEISEFGLLLHFLQLPGLLLLHFGFVWIVRTRVALGATQQR